MNVLKTIADRFAKALEAIGVEPDQYLDLIRPSQDVKFGDFQANFAMPLGKKLGKAPRDVAADVVARLDYSDFLETPEIAGPGFINLRVKTDYLASLVQKEAADDRLGVEKVEKPRKIVLDYSAPNVAKPLHVGHIRSTMIGNSLARILRFLGNDVVADNHLGDWGTQFGMIIYGYRNFLDPNAYEQSPVDELARLYRLTRQLVDYQGAKKGVGELEKQVVAAKDALEAQKGRCAEAKARDDAEKNKETKDALKKANKERDRLVKALESAQEKYDGAKGKIDAVESNPELVKLAQGRETIAVDVLNETSKLHHGDEANLALWRQFMPQCLAEVDKIYKRLDVQFDETLGESFYNDRLGPLVERLKSEGIARETEGAVGIFFEDQDVPMLIQKSDGAYLYATTDLATLEYRRDRFRPDAILYVVDFRQSHHFEQLFEAAKFIGMEGVELTHVKFGAVLGDDGRPFKTRAGDAVGLKSLLDEAELRALAIVEANDAARDAEGKFSEEEKRETAKRVGIGALVYADLSQNRESDYVFSYDKMLAMNGNTATYMQYAYARVRSIFARGGIDVDALRREFADGTKTLSLGTPEERALAFELTNFQSALETVSRDYRPNFLTAYLYVLANKYSSFFEKCPVLKAEDEDVKASRLLLCDLTSRTIAKGLELLGIQTVERM
ncbi:MAG: arginine--tRNA ligase [Thermoguttaceae bacterium]|nr:arginine--tRNA ligase [Thermoguttaceae bacterium]